MRERSYYEMQCPCCGERIIIRDGRADCPSCDYRAKVEGLPGEEKA